MTTHAFIDEDADLACQNLNCFNSFLQIGDKTNQNNGTESDKKNEAEKEETEAEITLVKALEMVHKMKTHA